jgi:protein SCO1/2
MGGRLMRRSDVFPLGALAVLMAATLLWWAFALWPLPSDAVPWLERARFVCFNTTDSGLPDASGWVLLIGQPIGMLALLMVGWGGRVREALYHLTSSASGRLLATAITLVMVGGLGAAGVRVAGAQPLDATLSVADAPETYPRLDRPWPSALGLVDQRGDSFTLSSLEGRPALVTFAFAHCATICPLLVRNAMAARDALSTKAGLGDMAVVALTLDPWRDTPSRLPAMAEQWGLGPRDFVLSGSVDAVEAALDAWGVQRVRDPANGDVTHPALVYLVEGDGTVAFAATGGTEQLEALGSRLWTPELVALQTLARQLDELEVAVADDDAWLGRNTRVMEGYAQHQEYARRLTLRGRRAVSHSQLLERYEYALSALERRHPSPELLPRSRVPLPDPPARG